MWKNSVCRARYLRNHRSYDHLWYTSINDNIPRRVFIFSKFWFFGLLGRSKGKNGPKWQKLWPLHFMSQESYIIWSWYMIHMCKRIISSGVFYIFSKFKFLVSIVEWKSKKWSKMTKNCLSYSISEYAYIIWSCFCCTSSKWWHLQMLFSFFQNFGFLGC